MHPRWLLTIMIYAQYNLKYFKPRGRGWGWSLPAYFASSSLVTYYVSALFRLTGSHSAIHREPPKLPMHGVWVPLPFKEPTFAKCISISLSNNFRPGLLPWPLATWEKWLWNIKWLIVSVNGLECVFLETWCWGEEGTLSAFFSCFLAFVHDLLLVLTALAISLLHPHHFLKASSNTHVGLNTHFHMLPQLFSFDY